MNLTIKEAAGIATSIIVATVTVLTWMNLTFATKAEDSFKYYDLLMGINEIRMQNYEAAGLDSLGEEDRRKYDAIKASQPELEKLRWPK